MALLTQCAAPPHWDADTIQLVADRAIWDAVFLASKCVLVRIKQQS